MVKAKVPEETLIFWASQIMHNVAAGEFNCIADEEVFGINALSIDPINTICNLSSLNEMIPYKKFLNHFWEEVVEPSI